MFRLLFPARKMSSFQPHESADPALCAAGCGFFGSPATKDMCSVCYKKNHCIVTDAASSTATASEPVPRSAVAAKPAVPAPAASSVSFAPAKGAVAEPTVPSSSAPEPATKAQPSRCAACYKKVGLTGFVCRCEKTFCGKHRYAEEHCCAFDFKGCGRDAIARSNPVIKGDKLACRI